MAKMSFNKDRRDQPKPISETKISKPVQTFSLDQSAVDAASNNKEVSSKGRPKQGKIYSTIRIQKQNVNRINALQNTLGYETQDALIGALLIEAEAKLTTEQNTMLNMYIKAYNNRQNNK